MNECFHSDFLLLPTHTHTHTHALCTHIRNKSNNSKYRMSNSKRAKCSNCYNNRNAKAHKQTNEQHRQQRRKKICENNTCRAPKKIRDERSFNCTLLIKCKWTSTYMYIIQCIFIACTYAHIRNMCLRLRPCV